MSDDSKATERRGADREPSWSRRQALSAAGSGLLLAGWAACRQSERADQEAGLPGPELESDPIYSSARALAAAIRGGEISSEEITAAYLERIEAVNPALNAVVQLLGEGALAAARGADTELARGELRGPLHGVPMTVKDSFDAAGTISTGGTKGREAFVPQRDATAVARLRQAGAILLGKTNTPELTLSYETDNLIYGRTNNPWDLERTPGGSSGGAAAILAAGGSAFDIGSDYGGSIRLPSHFCGTAGIKPTSGRVPRTGHIFPPGGLLDAFQQVGPMARWVGDLEPLLAVMAGPDGVDPAIAPVPLGRAAEVELAELRVFFFADNGIASPTAETAETVRAAAAALEPLVAGVEEGRPSGIEQSFELILALWSADGGASTRRLLSRYGTEESALAESTLSGERLDSAQLDALVARWDAFRREMLAVFDRADVVLSPVHAQPALPHGGMEAHFAGFSYTMTHNLTGWPGAVVRCGTSPEGLPIGVQVVAAPWREDQALAVAERLEVALGGYRRPAL